MFDKIIDCEENNRSVYYKNLSTLADEGQVKSSVPDSIQVHFKCIDLLLWLYLFTFFFIRLKRVL